MYGAILPLPQTSVWRGTYLNIGKALLYFTLLYCYLPLQTGVHPSRFRAPRCLLEYIGDEQRNEVASAVVSQ
jgi:hypothetical protein